MYRLIFCLFSFTFLGCNYSKEMEVSIWEQNQRAYLTITVEYPNHLPLLEFKMREAKSIWANSVKETNLIFQIENMQKANQTIYSLLGYFLRIQNKLEILQKSILKLNSYLTISSKQETITKLENINQTLYAIKQELKEKTFYNEKDLKDFLKNKIQVLEQEQDKLDQIFKETKL